MAYYLVYKTTNKINGKFYIGSHKTNNLDDDYLGSGKLILRAIEKYGVENFKKEILFVFDNSKGMYNKEAEIVNADFLVENNTYNLKEGGMGGWDYINNNQELRVKKNRKAQKAMMESEFYKSETYKNKISNIRKEEYSSGKRKKKHFYDWKGKKHKENSKTKQSFKMLEYYSCHSNPQQGKFWITNGIESNIVNNKFEIPEGWRKGRVIKRQV